MSLRPSIWLLLCQLLTAVIGVAVIYVSSSNVKVPLAKHHPSYQASRELPRNHLLNDDDLQAPDSISKEDLPLLPKKNGISGRYLTAKKKKGDSISSNDTRTLPALDATAQNVYYFLDLSNQHVPVLLLDAGIAVDLSYCANPSESKRECTPTTRSAEIAALLCDSSQTKKCVVALRITKVTEVELGHSPTSEPIRMFLLGQ